MRSPEMWLTSFLLAFYCLPVYAQGMIGGNDLSLVQRGIFFNHDAAEGMSQVPEEERRETRNRLVLLPIIFSSPDTRYAVGVLPQYLFYVAPESRPSRIRLDAFYTQEKQFNVTLRPQVWLSRNRYVLAGKFAFKKWPTTYYGIGGNTSSIVCVF